MGFLVFTTVVASQIACVASTQLSYGVHVIIENQFQNSQDGFKMLERDISPKFTVDLDRVKMDAAVWAIHTVNGDGSGEVKYGEDIVIENQYSSGGSRKFILERNIRPEFNKDGNPHRDGNSGVWRILPAKGNDDTLGSPVSLWKDVFIQNQYGEEFYLERNLDPSFSTNPYRDGKSGVWQMKPSGAGCPMIGAIQAEWKMIQSHNQPMKFTYSFGTQRTSQTSTTNQWGTETSISMSAGFDFFGAEAKTEISSSFSQSFSRTMTSSYSESVTETCEVTCPAGAVWQFQTAVKDKCDGAHTFSCFTACTENAEKPPCCLPGFNADNQYQSCSKGSPNLCHPGLAAAPGFNFSFPSDFLV